MSDIDPTEVAPPGQVVLPPVFDDHRDNDQQSINTRNERDEREGLPPGYRMRADAHYVDALTSRRGDRAEHGQRGLPRRSERADRAERLERLGSDRPDRSDRGDRSDRPERAEAPVESAPAPSERQESRERSERMLAQLAEDIATIESAAALLGNDTSRMARRANVDVIKAQAWRAGWLLRAKDILDGTHRTHFRPRPLAFLLGQVRTGLAAECRLTGVTFTLLASDWNAVVTVDEQGLVAGLTGAILATLGLIGSGEGAVRLTVEASEGELRTVEVAQDEVMITPGVSSRFFDAAWRDRPGGWTAGLGASTAKAVAQRHGGDAAFLAGERYGSAIRLSFNRASWFEWE